VSLVASRFSRPICVHHQLNVRRQRRRHRRNLFAVGGERDRNARLVEDGLGARCLRIEVVEQFSHQYAVLPLGIVGDFSRRG